MIAVGEVKTAKRGGLWKRVHQKTCVCCHRPFETTHKVQVACSQSCGSRFARMKGQTGIGRFLCRYCGKWYVPKTNTRTTFCSRDCSFAWMHDKKRFRQQLNGHARLREPRACDICGVELTGRAKRFCSKACRKEAARLDAKRAWKPVEPRPIKCVVCEKTFHAKHNRKYCKPCRRMVNRLRKATGKTRRRARIADALIESFNNHEVMQRDGWRCQICGRKILKSKQAPHPRSATIDHIIPLSLGGEHSLRNVQAACRLCNSLKSATVGPSQLRLF